MFGKKDEYKNILLFKKGNALVSVSSGWPYKWALRKKRPGHMLYCYKDYGRQRRRRVVNRTLTASKILRKAKEVKPL